MHDRLIFYIKNELKVRLRTSLLFWCYYSTIFIISLPIFLSLVFSIPSFTPFQQLPGLLLFLFLVFFSFNVSVFSREKQLYMQDYLAMFSMQFKTIYYTRIIANSLLMIIPTIIVFLSSIILNIKETGDLSLIFRSLILLPLFTLFFISWSLVVTSLIAIIEIRSSDSTVRVIFYIIVLIIIIIFMLFMRELLHVPSIIIEVIFGQNLFENIYLSLIMIILTCIVSMVFLSRIIDMHITLVEKQVNNEPKLRYGIYRLLEKRIFPKRLSLFSILPYLGILPYLIIFLTTTNSILLKDSFMVVFCYHFFILLLLIILFIFPKITVEKEFNMEEMILSQISAYRYFFAKVKLLVYHIFHPFLIAVISIILLTELDLNTFTPLIIILVIRAFYLISILIFIWRFFPTKDLLQSAVLTIFGLEIVGILLAGFLVPFILLVFSPILSCLMIASLITDPGAAHIILTASWMNVIIMISLFFASIILTKSEIRY